MTKKGKACLARDVTFVIVKGSKEGQPLQEKGQKDIGSNHERCPPAGRRNKVHCDPEKFIREPAHISASRNQRTQRTIQTN